MPDPTQEQFDEACAAYAKKSDEYTEDDPEYYEFRFSCEHVIRAGDQLYGIEITMEQAVDIVNNSPHHQPLDWEYASDSIFNFIRVNDESV